jgi:hypothetical protein
MRLRFAVAALAAWEVVMVQGSDAVDVTKPCVDMVEAWYAGDPEKMAAALHDDLAKRGVIQDPATGATSLRYADKSAMVEGARKGGGRVPPERWDIRARVLDRDERLATVRVDSVYLTDVCQVALVGDRWVVVNVLWTNRGTPPWWPKS